MERSVIYFGTCFWTAPCSFSLRPQPLFQACHGFFENNLCRAGKIMSIADKKQILLLIETSRSFGRQIIQGVSQFVMENRHWMTLFQDRSVHDHFPEWLLHWKGDGAILRTDDKSTYRQLKRLGIPMIELFGDGKKRQPLVRCNESQSCALVADHFRERGYRHFAFFSTGHNWWSLERFHAFQEGLKRYGATCDPCPMARFKNDITLSVRWWKDCEEEIYRWLLSLKKPVGIFCPWDMQAFFLINICNRHGIAVPDDVAVVGYGNNADLCRVSTPSLSSVAPNAREIGYRAAILLDTMFQGGTLPEVPIYIPATHIEIRQSSDSIAVQDSLVTDAVRFIRDRIDHGSLDVSQIARFLCVSNSTLTRRFRKELGHTPDVEIVKARIKLAMDFLRETRFTVAQISLKLGYANSANFIRAFRKLTDMTPEEYRYRNRQE